MERFIDFCEGVSRHYVGFFLTENFAYNPKKHVLLLVFFAFLVDFAFLEIPSVTQVK